MKRNWVLILTGLGVAALLAMFFGDEIVTFFGENKHKCEPEHYAMPITAEDVSSVSVSTVWLKCKQIDKQEDIKALISWMNGVQICPDYNEEQDIPATGDWGHEFCFHMKNGGEYTYHTVPLGEDTMLFTDESGVHYKVHNFDSHEIWDKLDYEVQTFDPFAEAEE